MEVPDTAIMASSIDSGVRKRMEEPSEGNEITLLVKLKETSDAVVNDVEATGVTVEEQIPLNYIAVTAKETELEDLCQLDAVESVEIEGKGAVMTSGFRSPTGSVP